MSASGPVHDGPSEQEPLEELFGTVFGLADEIASRIGQDQVEARLRRTLREAGRHREEMPAQTAVRRGPAGAAPHDDSPGAVLVSRAAAGNKDAWDEIVERLAPMVWQICRWHGLDRTDAEDAGQKVWLHLVDQLGNLRDPAALPLWLAQITHAECLRILTGRGSERRYEAG